MSQPTPEETPHRVLKIVRGKPSEAELVAVLASLATSQISADEVAENDISDAPAWSNRAQALGASDFAPSGSLAWKWSQR